MSKAIALPAPTSRARESRAPSQRMPSVEQECPLWNDETTSFGQTRLYSLGPSQRGI